MVNVPWCHGCDNPDGLCECEPMPKPNPSLIPRLESYISSMEKRMKEVEHLVSAKAYREAQNGVNLMRETVAALRAHGDS